MPLATLFLAYRAYISEREKHDRLELLYQSSRIMQHSPELDSALVALLDHARAMFRAEIAEVIIYARGEGGDALRTTSIQDSAPAAMVPVKIAADDPVHARVIGERQAFFSGASEGRSLSGPTIRQAMISPLIAESGLIGAMTVANRLTEGTSFDDDDLRLLETLANQAAVALENGQLEQSLAELSRLKEELRHQAYHDPLTGLANRSLFVEQVEAQLIAPQDGLRTVVLFLDLDDFKIVNDTLGHAAGDRLLAAVADRIRGCLRADDLAARLGGDEFAVLLTDEVELDRALAVAKRMIDMLQVSFPILGQEISIGGSIGIAVGRGMGEHADELLRNADVAMYTAKAAGKRRAAVFEPTMHAAIVARHALSAELKRSMGRGELAVFYQPIVELETGRIAGAEALVRWRHPTRGLVPPDEFIPLAEENGLILTLGRWVMAEACATGRRLGTRPRPDARFLRQRQSVARPAPAGWSSSVRSSRILKSSGLAPERLVVELTETAMFQDTQTTITKLEALRALGVRIALDDFGTGYSSLGYLRQFPVDILKIAREFVVPSTRDDGEWAFAHAIVALGQTLGLSNHRRGHRGGRPGRPPAGPRLRARPGLLLRPPGRGRRNRGRHGRGPAGARPHPVRRRVGATRPKSGPDVRHVRPADRPAARPDPWRAALRTGDASAAAGRCWQWRASWPRSILFSAPVAIGSALSARPSTSARQRWSSRPWSANIRIPGMALVVVGAASQPRGDRGERRVHALQPRCRSRRRPGRGDDVLEQRRSSTRPPWSS